MSFSSSYHIRMSPSNVLRDVIPPLYAKHSRMKMFKFRPRLVSGKRRSKVFWRVVVNIFIFRNSRNIHSAVFLAHSIQPSQTRRCFFWNSERTKRANKSERGRKWLSSRSEMCANFYAHLEGEDFTNKSDIVAKRFIDLLSFSCAQEELFFSRLSKKKMKILGMLKYIFFLVAFFCALVAYELHEKGKFQRALFDIPEKIA